MDARGRQTHPTATRRGPALTSVALLVWLAMVAGMLAGPGAAAARPEPAAGQGGWTGTWAAPPQRPVQLEPLGPNWSTAGFANQTVRQVVRVSAGGSAVRVRLSNVYGTAPLRLTGATVGRAGMGAGMRRGTLRQLTFAGSRSVVLPARGERASDAARLRVAALDRLIVTLYFARPTGPATFHALASATIYRAPGNRGLDTGGAAFTTTSRSWYYLTGVDVLGRQRGKAVVAFGDSITDGFSSTVDANNRYPDELAERLAAAGRPRAVLNAGISGNRLLNDSPCFGERASARFARDVLDEPRAGTVIVLEGINDIGASEVRPGDQLRRCFRPNPRVTARQLIAAQRELIRRAHERGVRVIGATLLPFKGAPYYSRRGEAVRDEVNAWIRGGGAYDAVVDFDRAMADLSDADRLRPAYDSGDHLHPNDRGYRAMAQAVRLSAL
jgi:lysophospholipase L1-like esterase